MTRTTKITFLLLSLGLLLLSAMPAFSQVPATVKMCTPTTGTACPPVSATNPMPITGSFSATLAGFTPNGNYATLTATAASSASTAMPAGTVVGFQNTSLIDVSCVLATGTATATTNKLLIRAGSTSFYTVGSNVNAACINMTGSASNVIVMAGGSGLGTAFGSSVAGGGGGGGAVTIADGADTTEGAIADAAATAGGTGTLSAKLRLMTTQLGTINTTLGSPFQAGGSIGNTTFASTQSGTWNIGSITTLPALASGTNVIGRVGIDQTTPGTTNLVSIGTNGTVNPTTAASWGINTLGSTTSGQSGQLSLGAVTTAAPTYTTAQTNALSLTTAGDLRTVFSNSTIAVTQATASSLNATVVGTGTFATQASQSGTWTVQPGNTANTTAWLVTGTGGTFPATQSGTWNITNISGTVSLPTGASTAANQTSVIGTKNAGTAATNSLLAGGVFNNTPLTLTDTQGSSLQLDANGYLKVNISAGGGSGGGTSSNFGSSFPTAGTAAGFTNGTNMVAASVGAVANVAAATNFVNALAVAQYNATPVTVTDTRYQSLQTDVNGFLKVNVAAGGASGGTSSTFGATFPGTGTAAGMSQGGNMVALTGTSGNLNVQCANCSGSGASAVDEATFTAGTSVFAPGGGFFQTTATNNALTNGQQGAWQMTAQRAGFVNLRDTSGTAVGTSAAELFVGGRGTAGSAAGGVLTVQGVASMTPVLSNPGTAANWGIGTSTQNSSSVANGVLQLAQFNTTPTTITSGNMSPLQMDNAGNLLVNIKAGSSSGAVAQGSTTSGQTGPLVQCAATSAAPTYTTATTNPLNCDTGGSMRVNVTNTNANGSTTSANSSPVVIASDQAAVAVKTASGAIASGSFASGAYASGSVASGAYASGALASGAVVDLTNLSTPITPTTATATKGVLNGGQYNSTQATFTNGQQGAMQISSRGAQYVAVGADGFAVTNAGTFAVQAAQSGTWNITNVSGTVSLPTGASTSANQPSNAAIGSTTSGQTGNLAMGATTTAAPTYTTAQSNPLSLTTAGALRVDASGSTQPVSGTVAATQSGTWTVQPGNTANTTAWLVTGTGGTFPSTQSGTWNITNISGTVSLPTGAATGVAQASTTSGQVGTLMQGAVTTAAPTYTTAQTSPLSLDTGGALRINCVTGCGGGSGGTASNFGSAFPTQGTAIGLTNGTNMVAWSATSNYGSAPSAIAVPAVNAAVTNTVTVSSTNLSTNVAQINGVTPLMGNGTTGTGSLRVTVASDNTAFTVNPASATAPVSTMNSASAAAGVNSAMAAVFDDTSPTAITENNFGFVRMSANRNQYTTIRDAAGNERGVNVTAGNALTTDTTSVNGVTTLTGSGAVGTGAQRIAVGTDTATIAGSAPGTAGTASTNVVTVQGIASMTALLANPGTSANWGIGATGSAVPANAQLTGGTDGTNTRALLTDSSGRQVLAPTQDPCSFGVKVNAAIATSSGTLQVVAPSASTQVYVCSMTLVAATAAVVNLVGGTGATCTTGTPVAALGSTTAASGASVAANGGMTIGSGVGTVVRTTTAGHGLCLIQSGTAALAGNITYVQQ